MIKIIGDSTCDLSPELRERYQVSILPLHILLDEADYHDGIDITPKEIFAWADANNTTPKTSAVTVEDVTVCVKPWLDQGDEVILFCISEKFSSTVNVARMVQQSIEGGERMSVIDSQNLSTGIGLLVVEAADMAQKGHTREEIVARMEELIPKVRTSFVVDTMTYLHRGGRCSGVTALAGSILKIHPEIIVSDGAMIVGRKYRGKYDSVILKYALDQDPGLKKAIPNRVFITHTGASPEVVESIRKHLQEMGRFDEILETVAGSVVSSHCGPGTLGVLYIEE